jgi:hypothetical protein
VQAIAIARLANEDFTATAGSLSFSTNYLAAIDHDNHRLLSRLPSRRQPFPNLNRNQGGRLYENDADSRSKSHQDLLGCGLASAQLRRHDTRASVA